MVILTPDVSFGVRIGVSVGSAGGFGVGIGVGVKFALKLLELMLYFLTCQHVQLKEIYQGTKNLH